MNYSDPSALEIKTFANFELEDGSELQFMPDFVEAQCPLIGNNFIDYPIPFDCKINGIEPILKNHEFGDSIMMQIGFFHPANPTNFVIVKAFGENGIGVDDSVQNQGWIEANYSATLKKEIDIGGGTLVQLFIRAVYKAKSNATAKKVILNFRLHKIIPAVIS